ncbi:MAG: protoheme IX farnesyltransferase [Chloroflexi bacterium]|nr:protoheme IX farnesyltransferase [Chloroflexota bacterium]
MSVQEQTAALYPAQPSLLQVVSRLFKLRIVTLLLFAATGGAFLAAGGRPALTDLAILFATGGLAAAGASALNQYMERERDAAMDRTRGRPLATGMIEHPDWVLWLAVAMIMLPVVAVWPFNPPLGLFLLLGAIIYVFVYTAWLKPRTVLNIVIGGAAGSCAVLSGGAAVGAWNDPGVLALAAIVFLWTPTHFWALAIYYRDDYAAAGVPMLPVKASVRMAAVWALIHAVAVVVLTVALAAHTALGWFYFVPALLASIYFLKDSIRLIFVPLREQAIRLFLSSNIYLTLVLVFICVSAFTGI